jgi:hypothetical protein
MRFFVRVPATCIVEKLEVVVRQIEQPTPQGFCELRTSASVIGIKALIEPS